jgi:anthranilate synthase component 1
MTQFKLNTTHKKIIADTTTPVNIYLQLRDIFPNTLLLESNDLHSVENSYSYICCHQIAEFKVEHSKAFEKLPNGEQLTSDLNTKKLADVFHAFKNKFEVQENPFPYINNGLFGYINYDCVKHFEDIEIQDPKGDDNPPDMLYGVYQYVIAINHFKSELTIFENTYDSAAESRLSEIENIIKHGSVPEFKFKLEGEETTNYTDDEFREILRKCKQNTARGDVFQIVVSRKFRQKFVGDEFNIYRALRSINPSPYLFYFDYGSFKLFGSSPEAQLIVDKDKAIINPIAGTFRRTGDMAKDLELAEELKADPKENAEHVMLVDLARNDLTRNGSGVSVDNYREIHYYSHVIHLVSKVSAKIKNDNKTMQIVGDTFPAGTLSGAPKHNAMKLINGYENENRGFYGGCVGFMSFDGNFNSAIMIRTFMSKNNILTRQAGAGVVNASVIESELQEVHNKLMALKSALDLAEEL